MVCTGTMIGFVLSGRLYKRRDFLKSFTEFISLLATNLRYSGDDIFTLVNSCAENSSLDLLLFQNVTDLLTNCGLKGLNNYLLKYRFQNPTFQC